MLMRPLIGVVVGIFLAACVSASKEPRLSADHLAIIGATVINPRDGGVAEHMTVIVGDDEILAVAPASAEPPARMRIIDGRGKFIIPGLWDAHVHLSKLGPNALSLFIANGVTGVRDMGSNLSEATAWRARIQNLEMAGPRIFTSGPMIESQANLERIRRDSIEDADRQRIGISNADEGRAAVRMLAGSGVDQIKMRTTPDIQTLAAVVEEAHRNGLPFAAHALASPDQMAALGFDSIEHAVALPPLSLSGVSEDERRALFRRMARAGVHMSNTAANIRPLLTPFETGLAILDNASHHADPHRKYVCGYLIEDWREQLLEAQASQLSAISAMAPAFFRELREMHEEGVAFMLGTDAAVRFAYPGFSMHDELEIMVEDVGLSPMETLRIATNGVAAFFGRETEWGAIAPGQAADFVMLDENPLISISNTRRIRGVMARGVWFDRKSLDALLRRVENDSRAQCLGGSRAGH